MPLADAITALSPQHYWKFNTASGDLSAADSVGTLNFSSAFNDGGGLTGPELGTTAQRLFSDQIWTTSALNANAWTPQTWLMLVSTPNQGNVSSFTDMLGWGDPSNRTARGFRIQFNSTGAQVSQFRLIGSAQSMFVNTPTFPSTAWHLLWWTITNAPNGMNINWESTSATASGVVPGTAPQNSDQLWIQSASPVVFAHLAAFNYVLNPTQIASISSQIVNWPLQVPINMPITTTVVSGGGLTATQATQLANADTQSLTAQNQTVDVPNINTIVTPLPGMITAVQNTTNTIQTDTHNIVNTLFPQLSDFLNTIMNGITTTIEGVGGAVSQTLGQLFSGKTPDLLAPADLGSACFPDTLTTTMTMGGSIYGVQVQCTTIPDWYVFTAPADDYSAQVLADLTITRSGNVVSRHPIHTRTFMLYPLPGEPQFPVLVELPTIPGDYDLVITPNTGVCVAAQLLTFP